MRIKETHTSPGIEVLEDEVPQERALAESRFPDDIQVLRPVLGMQQNKLRVIRNPIRAGADCDGGLIHGIGRRPTSLPLPMGSQCPPHEEEPREACTWC